PRDLRGVGTGAWVACCAGLLGAAEMLAETARTINPAASTIVLAMWIAAASLAGAACGWLAARAFPVLRRTPGDSAAFFSAFVVGHLFAPPLVGPGIGLLILAARPLRRSLLPRHGRLDALMPLGLVMIVGTFVLEAHRVLPPRPPESPLPAGAPLPGSIPVTISVHGAAPFPAIPAIHARLRELASEEMGARAALWSGRAPARTLCGTDTPRRLPGGGLSRFPERPAVRVLTALLPKASASDPGFRTEDALAKIVAAAGIPVLRGAPAPSDPPLFLRILEGAAPPDAETAARVRDGSAWIDVTFTTGPDGEIALAGEGIAMTRSEHPATLMDVAPTALHLLGLAIPRDCDGRVLLEMLDAVGPGSRPPRYRGAGARS
ncbi:MAG: hypothetical protein ACRDGR_04875, partial [bacterium]